MAPDSRDEAWAPRRHVDPRVIPFEPWDLEVDGRTLFERRDEPGFEDVLASAIALLRDGRAVTRSATPLPPACRDIGAVVIGGGGASMRTCEAVRRVGLPADLLPGAAYVGERGGFGLLAAEHIGEGVVVDVGQSSIKISSSAGRVRIARADYADDDVEVDGPTFLAHALDAAEITKERAHGLVIALPCAIDADGLLGSCSYTGFAGRIDLLAECLTRAGLAGVPTWVVNDAELAALSAAEPSSYAPAATRLVLTVGFGVGGALLVA
ncbi:MAG: hypothetical protein JWM74_4272 [Myxococcaceae bacterium]|nr:hypothetical protein [Myxococcaceae bacterium]